MMRGKEAIHRQILSETLTSRAEGKILESGRTICNSPRQVRGPLGRFPTAVELRTCPVGGGGAWHTHVTADQLKTPRNSIPDMSYVMLGSLDVMGVIGTDNAEYVLAAGDRDAMEAEFADALGEEVSSPADVMESLNSGRLNPIAARDRVRDRMDDLFRVVETGYDDVPVEQISPLPEPVETEPYERIELLMTQQNVPFHRLMASPTGVQMATADLGEQIGRFISDDLPGDVAGTAVGATVGTIVGRFVESLVFNE